MTFSHRFVLPLSCVLLFAGCGDETPSNAPESASQEDSGSIEDKVASIVKLRDQIRDGFTSGDVDAAHGPLHDVGDKLDQLSKLITKSDLFDEDKQEIEGQINTLFAAFGEIDKTLHGQEGSTWEEEANTIDEAMKKLAQSCETSE